MNLKICWTATCDGEDDDATGYILVNDVWVDSLDDCVVL